MKKHIIKLTAVLLILASLFGTALAAETRASEILDSYGAFIVSNSNGGIDIIFQITTCLIPTCLGATRIELQEREDSTHSWTPVAIYTPVNYPELQGSNSRFYRSSVSYSAPVANYQYRAVVIFYATNGSVSDARTYNTDVYTYPGN